jgi:predicted DNA-binding antitoxin AbrB/MazE fold protein
MRSISAHVKNGLIVPDEPIDLLDGVAVRVILRDRNEMTLEGVDASDAAPRESEEQAHATNS